MEITKEILLKNKAALEQVRDKQLAELNVTIGKLAVVNDLIVMSDAPKPEETN